MVLQPPNQLPMHVTIAEKAGRLLFPDITNDAGEVVQIGGIADLPRRAYLHRIADVLKSPGTFQTHCMPVQNVDPRALCHMIFPDGLRSMQSGAVTFITPYGGMKEGRHTGLQANWQGTIKSDHAIALSDRLEAWAISRSPESRGLVMDTLAGFNLYPNWMSLDEQNKGLPVSQRLEVATAQGSHECMMRKSDTSDAAFMRILDTRIKGLRYFRLFAGEEGSAEREAFLAEYAELIRLGVNNMAGTNVMGPDQAYDTAAIITATIDRGGVTMTPRRNDPNELHLLFHLQGQSRCYYDSFPATLREALGANHWVFGGDTRAKAIITRLGTTWEVSGVRPLNREAVGTDKDAAADPAVQEITEDPSYVDGQLARIEVHGSIFPKAPWAKPWASGLYRKWAAAPETAVLPAVVHITRIPKG